MTNTEAISTIREILGLNTKEVFASMVSEEGVEIRAEQFEVGQPIYAITPSGQEPCPDGEYTLEDGSVVVCKDGKIDKIKLEKSIEEELEEETSEEELSEEKEEKLSEEKEEEMSEEEGKEKLEEDLKEEVEEEFVEAELIDGTLVSTEEEDFKIGVKLFVISPEGKVEAPIGEHKTKAGLIVTVGDGSIIEKIEEIKEAIDEQVELTEEDKKDKAEFNTQLLDIFTELSKEIKELKSENTKLKTEFSKFQNKPAGEPIKSVKTFSKEPQGINKVDDRLRSIINIKNNQK